MLLARLCLALCSVSPGDVLVVDSSGGGDFTQLQPAVDAAQDGDILLVTSGQYGFVEIAHKGVSIIAHTGAVVDVNGICVRDTLVQHEVVLSGLESNGLKTKAELRHALELLRARGPVRVEDCALNGPDGFAPAGLGTFFNRGEATVLAVQALDLALARCTLTGGDGAQDYLCEPDRCAGGDALDLQGGSVSLQDCELNGGVGADNFFGDLSHGGNGGHGARVRDLPVLPAFAYASGSTFQIASAVPDFRFIPSLHGALLLSSPDVQQVQNVGFVPASGTLTVPFTMPALAPGVDGEAVYVQAFFWGPSTGRWLSGPLSVIALDPQF